MLVDDRIKIMSREAMEHLIEPGFPKNTAIICFYDPEGDEPIDYYGHAEEVFYEEIQDIDRDALEEYGYTYDTFFTDVLELAGFIKEVRERGLNIYCQCQYGQSRSAACAAAIKEYYEGTGIRIFSDYDYDPNKLIFHKLLEALQTQGLG